MAIRVQLEQAAELAWTSANAADPEKRAPLIAQYRALLADIAALKSESEEHGDTVDEIAQRRASRGASTA